MSFVEITRGSGAVVLGMPHVGTTVPDDIFARLNEIGRGLSDTDWHIDRLYASLLPSASIVKATTHRYVIDVNRDPDGVSLYPGQNTTSLCPMTDFDGQPLWRPGQEPEPADIEERRQTYHRPYHAALAEILEETRARHGVAILYDCHSIRSNIPFLFDGLLPSFNVGTNSGNSCALPVAKTIERVCRDAEHFDTAIDGRFKGGWTTRHYGNPSAGVHAIQMELAQRTYMEERAPWSYRADRADRVRPYLAQMLDGLNALALSGALSP